VKGVRAKKSLGQHFLNDKTIAMEIVNSLRDEGVEQVLELGPGMGILSEFLIQRFRNCFFIEIDKESVEYLLKRYPEHSKNILHTDFLKFNPSEKFRGKIALIGNFPYNISSQILFKVLEYKDIYTEVVGMFQKEVADRVVSKPGSRVYGILSVFIQAYFDTENILTLGPHYFTPPPKVNSSVIRLSRNSVSHLTCNEALFFRLVKLSFNQRRKMIRNSIKMIGTGDNFMSEYLTFRPEQLGVPEFVNLTNQVEAYLSENRDV
jgi:16S rRNA (adenine1518-N6/adenine1519-N6)-dimethyltransferase